MDGVLHAGDRAQSSLVIPDDNRFESDPDELVDPPEVLPEGWGIGTPDPADRFDVA